MNKCPICGGIRNEGTTTVTVDTGKQLFVIRQVPAQVCQQCGESWIDDFIAEKIEKIIEELKKHPSNVEIVFFKDAA